MNRKLFAGLVIAVAFSVPASAADKIKVGLITKFPVPFYSTMEDAAKKYAAAHPEIELVTGQGQAATDIEGQIALIESMITQGVNGLAITPVDPTVAPALDKAVAAGIKVVLVDNSIPNWKGQTALVSTNNLNGGKIAGEYLKTVLKRFNVSEAGMTHIRSSTMRATFPRPALVPLVLRSPCSAAAALKASNAACWLQCPARDSSTIRIALSRPGFPILGHGC
ncbi:sugar ABC transporter substrate-binding protein [Mesorhizobium sp. M0437]